MEKKTFWGTFISVLFDESALPKYYTAKSTAFIEKFWAFRPFEIILFVINAYFFALDESYPFKRYILKCDAFFEKFNGFAGFGELFKYILNGIFFLIELSIFFGVFLCIPYGIYYGLSLIFPTICLDFILTKTFKLFGIFGVIICIYYLSKSFFKTQSVNKKIIGNKDKWFIIIINVVGTFFLSLCVFSDIETTVEEQFFLSVGFTYKNIYAIWLVLIIPLVVGFLRDIKERENEIEARLKKGKKDYNEAREFLYQQNERNDIIALFLLKKAIECGVSEAYESIAIILQRQNSYIGSKINHNQTSNNPKKDPYLYFYRGNVKLDNRDFYPAIIEFDEAIGLDPEFAKAYMNRGIAYLRRGMKLRAWSDIKEAQRLGISEPYYYYLKYRL